MIIASKEAPLNPLDDAPEFEARPDHELIADYLASRDEISLSADACETVDDEQMLRDAFFLSQDQFDAISKISLPTALYLQSWKDLTLIELRKQDIQDQDTEYARQQLLTPKQLEEERNE